MRRGLRERDVWLRARIIPKGAGRSGVVLRYLDDFTGLRVVIDQGGKNAKVRLERISEGALESLATSQIEIGNSVDLEIMCGVDQIAVWVDGRFRMHATCGVGSVGHVGFYCRDAAGTQFESLRIDSLGQAPLLVTASSSKDLTLLQLDNLPDGLARHVMITEAVHDLEISAVVSSGQNGTVGLLARCGESTSLELRVDATIGKAMASLQWIAGGEVKVLGSELVPWGLFTDVCLRVEGPRAVASVGGNVVADVLVGWQACNAGRAGLIGVGTAGAQFDNVTVVNRTRCIGQWRIVDEGSFHSPSHWTLSRGVVRQSSNIFGASEPDAALDPNGLRMPGTTALARGTDWRNYELRATLRSLDDDGIGVHFRAADPSNGYRVLFSQQDGGSWLTSSQDGVIQLIKKEKLTYAIGVPFRLVVRVVEQSIRVWVNDALLFDVEDSTHISGGVGLASYGNDGAEFSDISVVPVPLEDAADLVVRPGLPLPLNLSQDWAIKGAVQGLGGFALKLEGKSDGADATYTKREWSDVGIAARIDSLVGSAGLTFRSATDGRYRLALSEKEVSLQRIGPVGQPVVLWAAATGTPNSIAGTKPCSVAVVARGSRIDGWINGTPAFGVIDSKQGALSTGKVGLWVAAGGNCEFQDLRVYRAYSLPMQGLVSDAFQDEALTGWTIASADGKAALAAKAKDWSVASGKLIHKPADGAKNPAMALKGRPNIEDCRVTALVEIPPKDGEIGVVFRQSKDKCGLFVIVADANGLRWRLETAPGASQPLTVAAAQTVAGTQLLICVDVLGCQVRASVNGTLVGEQQLALPASGRVGIYAAGSGALAFRSFDVISPVWRALHRFQEAQIVPDGSRLQLSTDAKAPKGWQGDTLQLRASESERAWFSVSAPHLRIVNSNGKLLHARQNLPPGAFVVATNVKWLRRADGSCAILTFDGLGKGTPKATRLKLTWHAAPSGGWEGQKTSISSGGVKTDCGAEVLVPGEPEK